MEVVHRWLTIVLLLCRSVVASPLSYASTVTTPVAYVPILAIPVSLFLFVAGLLAIKVVYMKHRRIGTIRSMPASLRGKRTSQRGPLVVGCLGSPSWETHLTSRLEGAWRRQRRRRSSFAYQLHTHYSTSGSRSTPRTLRHADRVVLRSSTRSSRITRYDADSVSRTLTGSAPSQRHVPTNRHSRYGDFGEFYAARLPGGSCPSATRRASPSSIRLVDGPSHSNQVDYAFLSALPLPLPPDTTVASPLMGTRDSFQLSRCTLKSSRKPAPPLPSLLFHVSKDPRPEMADSSSQPLHCDYLPHLRFSPLASIARVFHSQQRAIEKQTPEIPLPRSPTQKTECLESASSSRTLVPTSPWVAQEPPTPHLNIKFRHKRSQSYRGLAIQGPLSQTPVIDAVPVVPLEGERPDAAKLTQTSILRTPSGSSRHDSLASKKPLKSCLRRPSGVPMLAGSSPDTVPTPSVSDASCATYGRQSAGDQASILTPLTEDDIGMLGLDRFRWNDDIKEFKLRSSHMKKDSVALVPLWE